jgi:hypothetical protein
LRLTDENVGAAVTELLAGLVTLVRDHAKEPVAA